MREKSISVTNLLANSWKELSLDDPKESFEVFLREKDGELRDIGGGEILVRVYSEDEPEAEE